MLNDTFTRLRKSVRTVMQRSRKITGKQTDEDLMLYERLKPEDLAVIAKQYGQEAVTEYIRHMEARRMKQNAKTK